MTALAINVDSPKAEAAADFINWCVSEEGAKVIAETGTFPACGSAETNQIISATEGFPQDEASIEALNTHRRLPGDALHHVRFRHRDHPQCRA